MLGAKNNMYQTLKIIREEIVHHIIFNRLQERNSINTLLLQEFFFRACKFEGIFAHIGLIYNTTIEKRNIKLQLKRQ